MLFWIVISLAIGKSSWFRRNNCIECLIIDAAEVPYNQIKLSFFGIVAYRKLYYKRVLTLSFGIIFVIIVGFW